MRDAIDLVIGTAFWGLALVMFTAPCWAPIVAFLAGAWLGILF